jgi:hypothetical protein
MLRLLIAVLLVGAVVLGSARTVAGFEYEEPLVPGEFMTVGYPASPTVFPVMGTTIRFRLALEDTEARAPVEASLPGDGAAWARAGAPGEGSWISGDQFSGEQTGRALWNWAQ